MMPMESSTENDPHMKALRAMLEDGLAVVEIAVALGMPPALVLAYAAGQGLSPPPLEHSHLGCEDEALQLLQEEGLAEEAVAERLGVSPYTVRFWALEAGGRPGQVLPPWSERRMLRQKALRELRRGAVPKGVVEALGLSAKELRRLINEAR